MNKWQARLLPLITLTLVLASGLGVTLTMTPWRARAASTIPVTNKTGGGHQDVVPSAVVQTQSSFAPVTVAELIAAITTANSNSADDVIDLGGQTFTLTVVDNSTKGDNGLPAIQSDNGHKLVIENGRIERSTADSMPLFRLFYISNGANLILNRVTVTNGRASSAGNGLIGGGMFNQGVLTLNDCTVAGNQSSGSGGGIYNRADASAPTPTVTLNRCTIADNSSTSGGGGIVNDGSGVGNTATLVINNSTFANNSASQQGGGIYNTSDSSSSATMTINNSTFAGNSASSGGGGINSISGTATIGGCIIARNRAMGGPDVNGFVTSQGFNLIGEASNSSNFNQTGDQTGTQAAPLDPGLELDAMNKPLLKNNGGPTQTIALVIGSPALDKGKIFNATSDQRGVSRPMDEPTLDNATGGDGSDIGAFEAITCGTGSTVVTNTNDSGDGSLRCAIASAFTGSTITFNLTTPAAIMLTSGQLTVDKSVSIQGLGAKVLTVQRSTAGGTPNFRIFEIKSGVMVAISGLTITNGRAPDGGNDQSGGDGGGISNAGNLTLTAVTVRGNRTGNGGFGVNGNGGNGGTGGGIFNAEGAALTVTTSTVSNNRTGDGGNSAFISSGAGGAGGGIYNSLMSTFSVSNCTISGNQTGVNEDGDPGSGGGIYNAGTTTLSVNNCTITGNSAGNGGGIDAVGAILPTVGSSLIAGNSASSGPDFKGSVTSQGYNLIGDATSSSGFTQSTDQTGSQASPLNPGLELDAMNKPRLKDNGGPTPTIALLCNSPAVDKGKNFTSATTDQRGAGFARTFDNPIIANATGGDSSDIGAFESQAACNRPPVAQCHNVTISAGANCTASASINNGSSDPDAGDSITLSQSPAGPYAKGTTTVTLTVTDSHGATATCQATVTVLDSSAPTIACNNVPAQSANTNANCSALVPDVTSLVRAQSSDNCTAQASLNITQSPTSGSSVSGTGSHPITVTVKDADNNETTCVVAFTVNDTTAPTINCPPNITKSTDLNQCAAIVSFAPTATDNCSGVGTPTCTPPSGSSFPKGMTTVTCTVKDAANNQSAPCSFTVTVNDTQPPSITCQANITVPAASGQCGATVGYNAPIVSDNCPGVGTPLCAPLSGSTFPKGTTTVTCTVKDAANNQSACSFTVTVVDTQAPTIVCPTNIITNTINASDASVAVTFAAPAVADNCSGATVACVPPSGSFFPRGVTTVTCTATDASSNQTSCAFTVKVFDYVIVDDSNGRILRFLSTTGEYDFFDCRKSKSLSGQAQVTISSCKTELRDNKPDRTLTVLTNPCTRVGNATLTYQGITYTLSDTNLSNNIIRCP
jgi:hypothetical protein